MSTLPTARARVLCRSPLRSTPDSEESGGLVVRLAPVPPKVAVGGAAPFFVRWVVGNKKAPAIEVQGLG